MNLTYNQAIIYSFVAAIPATIFFCWLYVYIVQEVLKWEVHIAVNCVVGFLIGFACHILISQYVKNNFMGE